jgi:hypothetical protein
MAMYSEMRYGIPAYYFVFKNSGRYGIISALALLIIISLTNDKRKILFYEIITLANMLLTTKGVVYIIFIMYLCLQFMFSKIEKNGKLSLKVALPTAIIAACASIYQISSYLLDEDAPRLLLIKYGFVTAKKYFPFGSGFATYGSAEAAKHYSKLYRIYGWTHKWSMGIKNGVVLNDNYLATIIGETSYFGLILFLIQFLIIFRQVNEIKLPYKSKALLLSLFIDMMVCFIATGITKSSIGMLVFIILGVYKGLDERIKEQSNT